MATGTPSNFLASRSLKSAEWMAENAYIAPGFHRLLTAGGLTLGLWGGRRLMDIITARDAITGQEIPQYQAPEIVRPIHGIMRYNPYSDAATDRWKFVVDRMAPVTLGAVAAYWGSKSFFHGKIPGKEAFFPSGEKALEALKAGKVSTEATDTAINLAQSEAIRKLAAGTLIEGSGGGAHLFGAFMPLNNSLIALNFQIGADKKIAIPFMSGLNKWLGNHGSSSRGFFAAARHTAKWMESNIAQFDSPQHWASMEQLLPKARDCLQKFPDRTAADEEKMARALRELIDDAYRQRSSFLHANPKADMNALRSHIFDFVSGKTHPGNIGLFGTALDKFVHKQGFKLSESRIASGRFPFFSRMIGSLPNEEKFVRSYGEYIKKEFEPGLNVDQWVKDQLHRDPWKVAAAYGTGAAFIGATLAGAAVAASHTDRQSDNHHAHIVEKKPAQAMVHTAEYHKYAPSPPDPNAPAHSGNLVDWVNGKPLDVAHWLSRVVITPPSMHRFMNAAYLSAFLYGGMRFSNILTGRKLAKLTAGTLAESEVALKDVWAPLRPLHGLLAYTPGSAVIADRWRQAAHFIMPVAVGMFGTYAGSAMYFRDRAKALGTPETLEDYADRISMEQSKFYAGATAVTSIFNTGSGIHLLPVFNYSANLHNRYLLGSGQQVALPGLGKWWSGNAGTTPWGVKRTLQFMENYLTYNPAARPRELPALVHSLIGKLYPNLNETELLDKKQQFIDRILDVRDSYLAEGVIPISKRAALSTAMKKMLAGQGFEVMLRDVGLDPANANLAANGASGTIANFFGRGKAVKQLSEEYRHKFTERLAKDPLEPKGYLKALLDATPAPANDNPKEPASFAARVTAEPKRPQLLS